MPDIEDRLANLEREVQRLRDERDIMQLIAAYGPAVDTLSADETAALWTDDGVYDFGGEPLAGADAIGRLVDLPGHRDYVARGCAHVMALPVLDVDGDSATATGYSRVYVATGEGWKVERASANHWQLVRTAQGWRVRHRVNRLLDGSGGARGVLGRAFKRGGSG
jgi:uncharacterized protein (TIGR02246 family)